MENMSREEIFFCERSKSKRLKKLKTYKSVVDVSATTPVLRRGNAFSNTRSGFRLDINLSVRSGWEANTIRVLHSLNIPYEFEPQIFHYPIKRGNRAYTPDILLLNSGEWIEVKGYLDKNSKIKLRRFKRYYPVEFARLTMIISRSSKVNIAFCEELGVSYLFYEEISRVFKPKIPNWEGK